MKLTVWSSSITLLLTTFLYCKLFRTAAFLMKRYHKRMWGGGGAVKTHLVHGLGMVGNSFSPHYARFENLINVSVF